VGVEKVRFLKIAEILGIENVYQNSDRRLWGFLLQSFFDHFLVSEFFNSHASLQQLTSGLPVVEPKRRLLAHHRLCT
jgi:hypothetical protein